MTIELAIITRFCSRDPSRTHLSEPLWCEAHDATYATNGQVAIRVPGRVGEAAPVLPELAEGLTKIFEAAIARSAHMGAKTVRTSEPEIPETARAR